MIEPHNNESAVKSLGTIPVVFGDAVAGKEQSCAGLKAKRIFVFLFHGQIVLANQSLENTVVIDIFRGQIGKNICKLAEQLCCLKPLIERLPRYVGHIFFAEKELLVPVAARLPAPAPLTKTFAQNSRYKYQAFRYQLQLLNHRPSTLEKNVKAGNPRFNRYIELTVEEYSGYALSVSSRIVQAFFTFMM